MATSHLRQEQFRRAILHSNGLGMSPLVQGDEFSRSRMYIDTMEKFIVESTYLEATSLEPQTLLLSDEEKDFFWQNSYPVHWEEIFGVRTRSAFCIQLYSHIEAIVADVAQRIEIIGRCSAITLSRETSLIKNHRAYFMAQAQFEGPSEEQWQQMTFLGHIRNAYVHNQGHSKKLTGNSDFDSFIESLPHVSLHGNFIDLKAGACTALLDIAERFYLALYKEYQKYQSIMRALE